MPFYGPLKLSEANSPSTNQLPGQSGYTAYPQGSQFRIGGQSPGQDYIGLIAQELGKRFPGMSGLTSYPGQGEGGIGGGTSALGFSFDNSQQAGTLEGIGGVSPESLTALLSGAGAPQTIEELITRTSPASRASGGAGQATGPSEAALSSLGSAGSSMGAGAEMNLIGDGGGDPGGVPSDTTEGTPGESGFGGFGGFGPGMNATAAGITGGVLGGALGMGGGILGMGAGALSGFNAGQNLAEAVNARGEFGLVSTLGMGRTTGNMDDPSAAPAPDGALGVAPGGDVGPAAPGGQGTGITGGISAPGGLGPGPGPAGGIGPGGPGGSGSGDPSGDAPDGGEDSGGESGEGGGEDSGGEDSGGEDGDGGGGGGGGGGGSSVICTHLHSLGYFDDATFKADEDFGKTLPREVYNGYLTWARPVVSLMKKYPSVVPVVAAIAKPWAKEMAYQMGTFGRGSLLGKIIMNVGWVICERIGKRKLQASESLPQV